MKQKLPLLLLSISLSGTLTGQSHKHASDFWFFPGLTYDVSKSTRLYGQFIWFTNSQAPGVLLRGFIKVNKHLTLNPGYLYMGKSLTGYSEHTLMNGFTLTFPLQKFQLENRNLLWDRLRPHTADFHLYRNRLQLSHPFPIGKRNAKVYVFDEAFYFFTYGRWSRNRIAAGFAYDLSKPFNLDLTYIRQNDHFSGGINLFWITGTLAL